jgi:hypothetical protein
MSEKRRSEYFDVRDREGERGREREKRGRRNNLTRNL